MNSLSTALRKILKFAGWTISSFLFIVMSVLMLARQFNSISILIWVLIFLPPVYGFTKKYSVVWNILGRLVAFLLSLTLIVLIPSSPKQFQNAGSESPQQVAVSSEPPVANVSSSPSPSVSTTSATELPKAVKKTTVSTSIAISSPSTQPIDPDNEPVPSVASSGKPVAIAKERPIDQYEIARIYADTEKGKAFLHSYCEARETRTQEELVEYAAATIAYDKIANGYEHDSKRVGLMIAYADAEYCTAQKRKSE